MIFVPHPPPGGSRTRRDRHGHRERWPSWPNTPTRRKPRWNSACAPGPANAGPRSPACTFATAGSSATSTRPCPTPPRPRHRLRPLSQRPHRLDLTPGELTDETTKAETGTSSVLEEAARELEAAAHDARVAFDCLALGELDRAHTSALTARVAADAAVTALQAALPAASTAAGS